MSREARGCLAPWLWVLRPRLQKNHNRLRQGVDDVQKFLLWLFEVRVFFRPGSNGGLQVSLRGRSTSSEITDLGLEGLARSSELDQTRLQIGLLLASRFHAKCQIARLCLAPGSKFFVISMSLQTLGLDLRLQIFQELCDLVHWICPARVPTQGADISA